MCQPTVDPKVKLCVWVTKKKLTNLSRGGGRPASHCRNFEPNEKHAKRNFKFKHLHDRNGHWEISSFFWPSFVSFVLLPLTFAHPLLPLQNESAAFHRGPPSAPPLSETSAIHSLPYYGGGVKGGEHIWVRDIWREPWHSRRRRRVLSRIASQLGKRQSGCRGSRSGEQGENSNLRKSSRLKWRHCRRSALPFKFFVVWWGSALLLLGMGDMD